MAVVPEQLRPEVRALLDQLVAGGFPEMLVWVRRYGLDGAVLIEQPEEIWSHRLTHVGERADGSFWVELPLWTTTEAPSDLTADFEAAAGGRVELRDVHVL